MVCCPTLKYSADSFVIRISCDLTSTRSSCQNTCVEVCFDSFLYLTYHLDKEDAQIQATNSQRSSYYTGLGNIDGSILRVQPHPRARFSSTYHPGAERNAGHPSRSIGAYSAQLLPWIHGVAAGALLLPQGGKVNVTNVLKPALGYLCYTQSPADHCCFDGSSKRMDLDIAVWRSTRPDAMNPCSGASFPHERGSKTPTQLSLMLYLLHPKSNFNAS